jgi:outer membrane biosynthesis protein TonB
MDRDERQGLIIAGVGHLVLVALLSVGVLSAKRKLPPPEDAIAVDIVGLTSRAPNAAPQAAPAVGPVSTPPPEEQAAPAEPEETPPPTPEDAPPPPTPAPKAQPTPKPPAQPKVEKKTPPAEKSKPAPAEKAKPAPKATPAPKAPPRQKLDSDWLGSVIGKSSPDSAPAALSGPMAASLINALRNQIRPCWQPPSGAAAIDELVVTLRVRFRANGTIVGAPQIVEREGVSAANRPYVVPFEAAAMRAIARCTPVSLPDDLYDYWKEVDFPFDARL